MKTDFLAQIKADFPDFRFVQGRKFAFRPPKTIVIGPEEPEMELLTLHELGHAILRHKDFDIDVKRLKMESEAWEKARELCEKYRVEYDEEKVQIELDTYRDWLHKKSRCLKCGLTRFQTKDGLYHCPSCENFRSDKK